MSLTQSTLTRRDFLRSSTVCSLAATLPQGLSAQQEGSNMSSAYDAQLGVIPIDTRLKFNADGSRRRFAGNTVICHLPQQSVIRDAVTALGDALRSSPVSRSLALLPSDSYHVTILGGLTDAVRNQTEWPTDIPINTSISECNRILEQRFEQFKTNEELPLRFRLDKNKTLAPQLASGLQLVPSDTNEKLKVSRLRNHLADEVFRYRAGNHDTFGFHISLAYQMVGFTEEEKRAYHDILEHHLPIIEEVSPIIELGIPEFCTFGDMYRFEIRTLLRT